MKTSSVSRRNLIIGGAAVAAAGTAIAATGFRKDASAVAKSPIGFIYVGPQMDYGYNYSMDMGRQFVEETLDVETMSQENIPENAEVTRVMEKMIRAGCKIIFPTSYGYLDYAIKLGEKYPDVTFLHAGGLKTSKNVGTYFANSDDGMFLAGMAAGATTKTKKLGFLAAFPIPQVIRSINAFTLGAQSMNPDVSTRIVWTGAWLDPPKEADATNSLADAGIDVIGEQIDSPITLAKTAQQRGIYVVGKDVNVAEFAKDAYLTGASWNWGPMMTKLVEEIWAGTWKSSHVRGSLADGTVVLDPIGAAVPKDAAIKIEKAKSDILSGEMVVWKGPIAKQDGSMVGGDKAMPMEEVETMNFLVKGVEGKIG